MDESGIHQFSMTVYELCDLENGVSSLNEALDESLIDAGITHYATDVSYKAISVDDEGNILIQATYTPDYSDSE